MKQSLFFILLFVSLVVVSCISKKPIRPVVLEKTKEVIHTIRDTTFIVEKDSSYYSAYVECINGKPVLRDPQIQLPSNKQSGLKAPFVSLDGNQLKVDCVKEAQELQKQWQETYIKEHEQTPIYVPTPIEVERKFTWWQKTQIWFGRIFMGLLALVTVIGVLRLKKLI